MQNVNHLAIDLVADRLANLQAAIHLRNPQDKVEAYFKATESAFETLGDTERYSPRGYYMKACIDAARLLTFGK